MNGNKQKDKRLGLPLLSSARLLSVAPPAPRGSGRGCDGRRTGMDGEDADWVELYALK